MIKLTVLFSCATFHNTRRHHQHNGQLLGDTKLSFICSFTLIRLRVVSHRSNWRFWQFFREDADYVRSSGCNPQKMRSQTPQNVKPFDVMTEI